MDFVPIVPYNTTFVSIGMGQRYDVIVTASETTADYWMRAIPMQSCSDTNEDVISNILGIVRYDSTSTVDPTTTAYDYTDDCDDEDISTLVPYLSNQVSTSYNSEDAEAVTLVTSGSVILWAMSDISFVSEWNYPSLEQIADGNNTWTTDQHPVLLPTADETIYMVISTTTAQAHPIHLHGHDFWVLAQGTGDYVEGTTVLTTTDSPRRDVAMLPGAGYLVIAWVTDNPGACKFSPYLLTQRDTNEHKGLLHCHIAWHTAEGFALQLIERETEIPALLDATILENTCALWEAYTAAEGVVQDDSGV